MTDYMQRMRDAIANDSEHIATCGPCSMALMATARMLEQLTTVPIEAIESGLRVVNDKRQQMLEDLNDETGKVLHEVLTEAFTEELARRNQHERN